MKNSLGQIIDPVNVSAEFERSVKRIWKITNSIGQIIDPVNNSAKFKEA